MKIRSPAAASPHLHDSHSLYIHELTLLCSLCFWLFFLNPTDMQTRWFSDFLLHSFSIYSLSFSIHELWKIRSSTHCCRFLVSPRFDPLDPHLQMILAFICQRFQIRSVLYRCSSLQYILLSQILPISFFYGDRSLHFWLLFAKKFSSVVYDMVVPHCVFVWSIRLNGFFLLRRQIRAFIQLLILFT